MSIFDRWRAASPPRARDLAPASLLDAMAAQALLAAMVVRLGARVAWHAILLAARRV